MIGAVGCSKRVSKHTGVAYWNDLTSSIRQELLGIETESANVYDCIEFLNTMSQTRIQYVVAKGVVHVSDSSKTLKNSATEQSGKWAMGFCTNVVPFMSKSRMCR